MGVRAFCVDADRLSDIISDMTKRLSDSVCVCVCARARACVSELARALAGESEREIERHTHMLNAHKHIHTCTYTGAGAAGACAYSCPNLRSLSLSHNQLTEKGFTFLARWLLAKGSLKQTNKTKLTLTKLKP